MRYEHTQTAPLYLLLIVGAGGMFVGGIFFPAPVVQVALSLAGALMFVLALGFRHLTVMDEDDQLAVRFGPLPLFRRSVVYEQVERVEPARSTWLDGWGIHYAPSKAIWNLWGFGCVDIHFKNGKRLILGTDEPQQLAEFIQSKVKSKTT